MIEADKMCIRDRYDFTTITLNGRKIRALDTRRLTVFELCNIGGIKPEQLMARSGKALSFTLNGERVTLRGTASVPAEISLNGRECSLNAPVRKGDEVNVVPAKPGEDAAALLSDYFELSGLFTAEVSLDGRRVQAGEYLLVNDIPTISDADIENGAVITLQKRCLLYTSYPKRRSPLCFLYRYLYYITYFSLCQP